MTANDYVKMFEEAMQKHDKFTCVSLLIKEFVQEIKNMIDLSGNPDDLDEKQKQVLEEKSISILRIQDKKWREVVAKLAHLKIDVSVNTWRDYWKKKNIFY